MLLKLKLDGGLKYITVVSELRIIDHIKFKRISIVDMTLKICFLLCMKTDVKMLKHERMSVPKSEESA